MPCGCASSAKTPAGVRPWRRLEGAVPLHHADLSRPVRKRAGLGPGQGRRRIASQPGRDPRPAGARRRLRARQRQARPAHPRGAPPRHRQRLVAHPAAGLPDGAGPDAARRADRLAAQHALLRALRQAADRAGPDAGHPAGRGFLARPGRPSRWPRTAAGPRQRCEYPGLGGERVDGPGRKGDAHPAATGRRLNGDADRRGAGDGAGASAGELVRYSRRR